MVLSLKDLFNLGFRVGHIKLSYSNDRMVANQRLNCQSYFHRIIAIQQVSSLTRSLLCSFINSSALAN